MKELVTSWFTKKVKKKKAHKLKRKEIEKVLESLLNRVAEARDSLSKISTEDILYISDMQEISYAHTNLCSIEGTLKYLIKCT